VAEKQCVSLVPRRNMHWRQLAAPPHRSARAPAGDQARREAARHRIGAHQMSSARRPHSGRPPARVPRMRSLVVTSQSVQSSTPIPARHPCDVSGRGHDRAHQAGHGPWARLTIRQLATGGRSFPRSLQGFGPGCTHQCARSSAFSASAAAGVVMPRPTANKGWSDGEQRLGGGRNP